MNSRQLQYAIQLAEKRNFSHVAEIFDITQPALSKQIISLETELGVKLFDRSTSPLTLTPAGEFFIEKARELLFEEDVLLKTIERFKTGENGKLTIGVSPFRALYLMSPVIEALKKRFPGLQIVLCEQGRASLHKGILEGLYDFIITNLPIDDSTLEACPLEPDTLVLAVPNHLLSLIDGQNKKSPRNSFIDLSTCSKLPFVVVSQGQEMRQLFDKLCKINQISPNIYVEVTGIATAWSIVKSGLAATLIPKQFVLSDMHYRNDIALLELDNVGYSRQPAIVTRRGQFVSEYARFAMLLLSDRYQK